MNFIDLFAGIGGFRSGLEKAGHQCIGYIEWDKFARQSYEAIYDTDGEFTAHDIQKVKGERLPDAELWTFGSPCTNISIAGNRIGIGGEQSRMFFEVIRLLQERITHKKTLPSYLIMENVKNLLSSNQGRDFAEVIYQMDKVGYDPEWAVIDSSDVVPQHRERIYIVGHLRGECFGKVFPIQRKSEGANRKPKIKIIGNVSKTHHHSDDVMSGSGISKTITAQNAYKHTPKVAVRQNGGSKYITAQACLTPDRLNKRQNGRRFKEDGEPSFTLTAADRHGVMLDEQKDDNSGFWYHGKAIRKLTPLECWRLQGFSDEQFAKAKEAGISNSQLYKQAGNAVTVPVVEAIGEKLNDFN